MKILIYVLLTFFSIQAYAKHPQCAGSSNPVSCEDMWDELDRESNTKKQERIKNLEKNRYGEFATSEPKIGMTKKEVIESDWGAPLHVTTSTSEYGISENWTYPSNRYLHFQKGILDYISK